MTKDPIATMMLVELALRTGNVPHEAASQVVRPEGGGQISHPIRADGHALVVLDLIVNANGNLNLCEANGSNAAASSFGDPEGDTARAAHQVAAARHRIVTADTGVVLICYATGTGAIAEILARASLVTNEIAGLRPCRLTDASQELHGAITVVVDTVEVIARYITDVDGRLFYRGVEVVSIANPNLLPELVRCGTIRRDGPAYCIDTSVFHDGPLVELIHDKGAQQSIAAGTGITPLAYRICDDEEACVRAITEFNAAGNAVVAKMNGGSGGTGIEFFGPGCERTQIGAGLARLHQAAADRYEGAVEKSIWPIRIFTFAESTGYPVAGRHHLWDMRVVALISPGKVDLTFCGIRLCPEPFERGSFDKKTVLSNVTGRSTDLETTLSPLVEFGRPTAHLKAGGVDEAALTRISKACARWCEAAWAQCAG
jgi:hypothetical protein